MTMTTDFSTQNDLKWNHLLDFIVQICLVVWLAAATCHHHPWFCDPYQRTAFVAWGTSGLHRGIQSLSVHSRLAAPPKIPPSNYTNPAYFIVEGVSVGHRSDDAPPTQRKDPQVVWSGKEALQLPKISGHHGRVCRRSDFTEIEIPAILIQRTPNNDLRSLHTNPSYQLFPTQTQSTTPSQYHDRNLQARDNSKDYKAVRDSILPEKNLRNLFINHSAIITDETGRDQHDPAERTNAVHAAKAPLPFPYAPTQVAQSQEFVPWVVEQKPPGLMGDNSLTALQIAKSLSEVDFFPAELKGPFTPSQVGYRNDPSMNGGRGYSWEKEVKPASQCQYLTGHDSSVYPIIWSQKMKILRQIQW